MANTLTALTPVLYSAAQEVSNEPFGAVDAINGFFDNKGVAIGDKIKVPVAPTRAAGTYSPTMNLNNGNMGADAIAEAVEVEITANRMVSWHLTGEQVRSLENGGNDNEWVRQLVAQGMRTLRNEAEAACAAAINDGASRATGTAGTPPFASSLAELTAVRKILRDNGAPMADLQLVVNTDAELNLLNLGIIQQAYAAGSDAERRQGKIARQFGFQIGQSAGIVSHTSCTGTNYVTDTDGGNVVVGTRSFVVDTGTAAITAGDVFTIADAGAHKYVVGAALANAAAGPLVINRPGIRQQAAQNKALTFSGNYTPSLAFERSAVVGVMRPPLIPANPSIKQMVISDDKGMSYLLCEVVGDGVVTWRIHLCYGFKVVQPEHVALILG
jgi:hypothetical protein